MRAIDLNFYLFIAAVLTFAAFGFFAARKEQSISDFFHHSNLHKNIVSLSATDVSLGTGLVYLVTGAQHNGLLMLIVPVAVWLGYYLQAVYLEKVAPLTARSGKNFLGALDEQISLATGSPSVFARVVSACLVSVFILILAFEIFASSKVVAPFLFERSDIRAEAWMSVVIFSITIAYAILGGVRAIFNVDFIQVPLICTFLPVFIFTGIPAVHHPVELPIALANTFRFNSSVLIAIGIAAMNAITTQFYSILNWGAISNVKLQHQQKLLTRVGALSATVLAIFVLVGLLHPVTGSNQVWQDISDKYSALSLQTGFAPCLISAILLLGVTSILLTTTDAVVVNAILFWYDNVVGGNSLDRAKNPAELKKIRVIGATAFGLSFGILLTLNYWQPDPFYLLLSMAGGVVVFAPLIVTAGYLCSIPNAPKLLSARIIYGYVFIFVLSGLADVILLSRRSNLVTYVGALAFLAAAALSAGLILAGRRYAR